MEKLLSIKQASEILKVSPETLRRWDNNGKFKCLRHPMNNYRVYSEEQLEKLASEIKNTEHSQAKVNNIIPVFFQTELGKLHNHDAIEFLKQMNSNSVDLIFADPPYNIKKAEWDTFASQKEYVQWSMEWITEAHRVLKNTGSLYICGFSEILADIKWAASPLFKGCKWLVWFYRNKANLGSDWGRSHESILHFRKSKDFRFNIDEIRIPYNEHTLKYPKRKQAESSQYSKGKSRETEWEPNPLGAKPKDVLEIPTISNGSWERYQHLTQKPVELLRKVILSSSNEGDLILDPFGGSGTTFAVAEAYNRRWLGTELETNYCNVIQARLSDIEHIQRIATQKDEKDSVNRRKKLRG
ncbi:DNA methyltransferase [Elizabethkingia anophelis]|uniref:DNA methyltransferase n=1 Tax=Elizabethkingia anophelis TaxID=1117645 RepID=UPI000DD79676|nr:DNA methyltransferase [Elizabethkingia anophelis]RBA45695.1 methyltransferase [Elizabethkingia anophelis]